MPGRGYEGRAVRAALVCAVVGLCALSITGPAAADQLFAPNSYRNTPLPDNAPIDLLSPAYVLDLASKAYDSGAFVNHAKFSAPVYRIEAGQARRTVTVDNPAHRDCRPSSPCLAEQFSGVPLPDGVEASPGSDSSLILYQPGTDTAWEFWRFRMVGGQPHAYYGARIDEVDQHPGYLSREHFGVAASGIPLLVGLQRLSELRAGQIDHVVSFAMKDPQGGFRWPAQRGDGENPLPTAAQEGTCFRLPASLDVDKLGLTVYGRILARAVQRYGMVLTDETNAGVAFPAEIPTDGSEPYDQIFGGLDNTGAPGGVLNRFPWERLQALAPGTC
jgi:hypothetical protein